MKDAHGFNYLADLVAVIMTATQTNEVFQIISLTLTIIATLFSIVLTAIRLYFWFKDAKADGKITKEEVDEANKIIEDGTKQDHLNNK